MEFLFCSTLKTKVFSQNDKPPHFKCTLTDGAPSGLSLRACNSTNGREKKIRNCNTSKKTAVVFVYLSIPVSFLNSSSNLSILIRDMM